MTLCTVSGTIVATQKNEQLTGHKLLICQPIDLDGNALGRYLIAIDRVDAGVGDTVLVLQEGAGAQQILGSKTVPVHSIIVAVVDGMSIEIKK